MLTARKAVFGFIIKQDDSSDGKSIWDNEFGAFWVITIVGMFWLAYEMKLCVLLVKRKTAQSCGKYRKLEGRESMSLCV